MGSAKAAGPVARPALQPGYTDNNETSAAAAAAAGSCAVQESVSLGHVVRIPPARQFRGQSVIEGVPVQAYNPGTLGYCVEELFNKPQATLQVENAMLFLASWEGGDTAQAYTLDGQLLTLNADDRRNFGFDPRRSIQSCLFEKYKLVFHDGFDMSDTYDKEAFLAGFQSPVVSKHVVIYMQESVFAEALGLQPKGDTDTLKSLRALREEHDRPWDRLPNDLSCTLAFGMPAHYIKGSACGDLVLQDLEPNLADEIVGVPRRGGRLLREENPHLRRFEGTYREQDPEEVLTKLANAPQWPNPFRETKPRKRYEKGVSFVCGDQNFLGGDVDEDLARKCFVKECGVIFVEIDKNDLLSKRKSLNIRTPEGSYQPFVEGIAKGAETPLKNFFHKSKIRLSKDAPELERVLDAEEKLPYIAVTEARWFFQGIGFQRNLASNMPEGIFPVRKLAQMWNVDIASLPDGAIQVQKFYVLPHSWFESDERITYNCMSESKYVRLQREEGELFDFVERMEGQNWEPPKKEIQPGHFTKSAKSKKPKGDG